MAAILVLTHSASAFIALTPMIQPPMLLSRSTAMIHASEGRQFKDDEMEDLDQLAETIKANIFEGTFGTRGEVWVLGQALAVGAVAVAPDLSGVAVFSILLGFAGIGFGFALAAGAAYNLGSNLTPWPKPVEASELQTNGVYALCRHPIYTGLIVGCTGLGFLTCSYERLVLSLALVLLLNAKATREEEFLNEKHGELYGAYSANVPKLFPAPHKALEFLRELQKDGL